MPRPQFPRESQKRAELPEAWSSKDNSPAIAPCQNSGLRAPAQQRPRNREARDRSLVGDEVTRRGIGGYNALPHSVSQESIFPLWLNPRSPHIPIVKQSLQVHLSPHTRQANYATHQFSKIRALAYLCNGLCHDHCPSPHGRVAEFPRHPYRSDLHLGTNRRDRVSFPGLAGDDLSESGASPADKIAAPAKAGSPGEESTKTPLLTAGVPNPGIPILPSHPEVRLRSPRLHRPLCPECGHSITGLDGRAIQNLWRVAAAVAARITQVSLIFGDVRIARHCSGCGHSFRSAT